LSRGVSLAHAIRTPQERGKLESAFAEWMMDFQIPRNDIQIFSERNPSRAEQIANPAERNPNILSFIFQRLRPKLGDQNRIRPLAHLDGHDPPG
jgi:hypothetical protein